MNTLILIGLAGCLAAGALWWRQALPWVYLLLFTEGLPRLWLGDPAILLLKDALLLGIYAGFGCDLVLRRARFQLPPALAIPLLGFTALALLETLNPALRSPWIGVAGIKSTLLYVPLIFVTPAALSGLVSVRRYVERVVFLGVPVCLAGMAQFFLGYEFYGSLGEGFREALFITGGHVNVAEAIYRPNATFAWSGHYGAFLLFSSALALALALARRQRRALLSGVCVLNLTAAVTSGQRSLFLFLPMVLVVILWFQRERIRVTLLAAGIVCVVVAAALAIAGPFVVDRFLSIFEEPEHALVDAYVRAVRYNFAVASSASVLGSGLGTASPASRHVGEFVPIENYYARTRYELGWPGLALLAWFLLSLLLFERATTARLKEPVLRGTAAAIVGCHGVVTIWGLSVCMLDFPIFAIFFWGLAGVVVRLSSRDAGALKALGYPKAVLAA